MRTKYDLSQPYQLYLAREEMNTRMVATMREDFKPRDEILEQLGVCKELRVSYESLESMDYLIYQLDFKYASIMLRGIYDKAMKDQQEEDKKSDKNQNTTPTQRRIMDVQEIIRQNNL